MATTEGGDARRAMVGRRMVSRGAAAENPRMNQLLPLAVALLAAVVAVDQAWEGPERNLLLMLGAVAAFVFAIYAFYRSRSHDGDRRE